MELSAHGSWRLEEGATSIRQNRVSACTAMHRMSHTLLQVDQLSPQLDIALMVLMWLSGIHWLHPPPHELPLFVMKVVPAPFLCLIMTLEVVLFLLLS
uniref:Uncharacterized protein n=1 Tax=Salix viminalis TaxID=40686 RepID=A0A6N2KY83_SALVM